MPGALNTSTVVSYLANRFGLHDVIENTHVGVGSSWGSTSKDTRVANRVRYLRSTVDDSIGIRVAKTLT